MITAVDTNVLLDVFLGDDTYGPRSREALRQARDLGGLIAGDVVWAETLAAFAHPDQGVMGLEAIGIAFDATTEGAARLAAEAWRDHRAQGGQRKRIVSDFLVAAHARERADQLLTRDRGFYRRYFSDLTIVDPST